MASTKIISMKFITTPQICKTNCVWYHDVICKTIICDFAIHSMELRFEAGPK